MQIDWSRVARPQADGYDLRVILAQALERGVTRKPAPGDARTFCDGRVPVLDCPYDLSPHLVPAPLSHPNIDRAEVLLKMWPEGYEAFSNHCTAFWPVDRNPPKPPNSRGVFSGHDWNGVDPNGVFVSVYDPQGCVEGLVHEIGHVRLASLGIGVETHDHMLLENAPEERYQSPVRADILRPMSAVFHGQYAWAMLSEADLRIGEHLPAASAYYLARNIPKLAFGLKEMTARARYTPAGSAFFGAFYEWVESIVERGYGLLRATGVEAIPEKRDSA